MAEEEFKCTYDDLNYDEACVNLKSKSNFSDLWLYTLSSDCVKCPYSRIGQFISSQNSSVKMNTVRLQSWRILRTSGNEEYISSNNNSELLCELVPQLGQFGVYDLTATDSSCDFQTIREPTSAYKPLLIAVGSILFLLFFIAFLKFFTKYLQQRFGKTKSDKLNQAVINTKRRIKSLDTVRGISIIFMIFVNDGAGGYPILGHTTWNGLFAGDLVFPCFIWIMGVCIPLSISSQLSRGNTRISVCWAIVKRSFYLFLIGLSINTVGVLAELDKIRIFGVLQRFSIAYLIVAVTYALLISRTKTKNKDSVFKSLSEVFVLLPQWVVMLIILGVHSSLIFLLPVPGCPKSYLGPGGRHYEGKYLNCTGGATGYIDKALLGTNHIYQGLTIRSVYGTDPFDPEGILGCLTAIFQTFLGVQAGQILLCHKGWTDRVTRWLFWALLFGCSGSALHFTDIIPVNKNLWSLSFVLVTTSFSLCLLTACYLLVDIAKIWDGGPFRIPGMNALVMYMGHEICFQLFPFNWQYGKMNTHSWRLAETIWGITLWTIVAYILHHKKIYITV